MKSSKAIGIGLAFLFFATTVLVVVPNGVAQQTTAQITIAALPPKWNNAPTTNRLTPESSSAEVEFKFVVTVPEAAEGATAVACPTANVVVTFTKKNPGDWASTTLTPTTAIVPIGAQDSSEEVTTKMTIVTTRKARAFVADTYQVSATAQATTTGCTYGAASTPVPSDFSIVNDYIPIMEYSPARYIVKTGQNKEVAFPIELTNFGNAQTRVTTTVTQPNKNKLDAVIPPSVATLNTELESKTDIKKTLSIQARTPHSNGYTNSLYSFTAQFAATATATGKEIATDTQALTLSVQVQGVYVPGFDFVSIVGALAVTIGIAGLVRRRLE